MVLEAGVIRTVEATLGDVATFSVKRGLRRLEF